jgi:hypothetical protein
MHKKKDNEIKRYVIENFLEVGMKIRKLASCIGIMD